MRDAKYYPPIIGSSNFNCPYCNVYANQKWAHLQTLNNFNWRSVVDGNQQFIQHFGANWVVSKCEHCGQIILWIDDCIIYPKKTVVELPNTDLEEPIKKDYIEASIIYSDSPRAAAALLRLALQKLCKQLGERGENINDDIKILVGKGLNPLIQKSFDALRITGNNAVHPGEINLEEEPEKVLMLFRLINFIADKMISEPNEIERFYTSLPENAIKAIEKRDKIK
jgi:hypothetical protein